MLSRKQIYFKNLYQAGLDLIWPKICLVCKETKALPKTPLLCLTCSQQMFAPKRIPLPVPLPHVKAYACGSYNTPLGHLIKQTKFDANALSLRPLYELVHQLIDYIPSQDFQMVTYIPSVASRIRKRGIYLPAFLSKKIAKSLNLPLMRKVLYRTREVPEQVGLNRAKRLANVRNLFEANLKTPFTNILLIDDVLTTGATLSQGAKALLNAGAEHVTCVCIAWRSNE